tara:strand:- start:420 stop:1034 length:615 start_codon:yes stop_codon:yes gene_type:complete
MLMKYVGLLLFIFCSFFERAIAQSIEVHFAERPSIAIKFAPRLLSPRISFEKIINHNSSYLLELRGHTYWLPSGARLEGAYRRYFNDNGILGPYIQPKLAFGYFDYFFVDRNTRGIQFGGGLVAGAQFNIGSKNFLIDVFGGLQWIAPFYLELERINMGNQLRNYGYNAIHYLMIASPIEIGVRFGLVGKKLVQKTFTNEEENF